jgi:hypothetical protein
LGKKIAALIAALVITAAGIYFFQRRTAGLRDMTSPMDAIPSADGTPAHMLVGVEDTASLSSAISFISNLAGRGSVLSIPGVIPDFDAGVLPSAAYLDMTRDMIDASRSMAMLVTSDDAPGLYVSMFVDDAKFDPLVKSGDGRALRVEAWPGAGNDAWTMRPSGETASADVLYITRRNIGGNSVVNIANAPELIGAMSRAAANPAERVKTARKTELPNFVRIKLEESADVNGLSLSEAEASWNRTDGLISLQMFSDMYGGVSARLAGGDFSPPPPPLLGYGEPALLASIDPAFFIYAMFPSEDDPFRALFRRAGASPLFSGDIEAILRQSRISAVVTTRENSVGTAYLILDTGAVGSVDKLFGVAGLLLGGGREENGWDSVISVPTGTSVGATVARRGGRVLFGAGDWSEYAKSADISDDAMKKAASPSNAFGAVIFPSRLIVSEGEMAGLFRDGVAGLMESAGPLAALRGDFNPDKIDRFSLAQSRAGRIDIDIFLRK